ncbi:ABC transporter permease [Desnuesiella massiliensis]|uniref:ABC transporter permease n=1 Tax=Desnuesiella massiliensis TaxID=1650662 RepID=UPI0006E2DE5D|nr:ABC transporter permease [Desnuesiella massiliensis]
MKKYILKRLTYMFFAVFVISIITFVLVKLTPGNYIESERLINQNMENTSYSPEIIEAWKKSYDLDKPWWYQYGKFTLNSFRFKFGPSYKYPSEMIEDQIAKALPISMQLAFISIGLSLIIGIPLGIIAALRKNTIIDRIAVFISMLGNSIPNYIIAVFLMYLLGNMLHLVPIIGWGKPINYILPVLSLAIAPIGSITRYMRANLVETLNTEYIRVAVAKGGGFKAVVIKHALRNSLIPLVTVVGPQIAMLTVGTVFIENMFNIPGLGKLFASAAINRDYPMIMASTIFFAFLIMGTNLIVDLIYGVLDPRIRKNSMMEGR